MAPGGHEPDDVGDPVPVGAQRHHRRAAAAQLLLHLQPVFAAPRARNRFAARGLRRTPGCDRSRDRAAPRRRRRAGPDPADRAPPPRAGRAARRSRATTAANRCRRGSPKSPRPDRVCAAGGAATRSRRADRRARRPRRAGWSRCGAASTARAPGRCVRGCAPAARRSPRWRRCGCRRRWSGGRPRPSAATTRSRFWHPPVPKSRLADRSMTSQVSSSRSAIICRTCGWVVRAVTDQSIWRTSSPG